MNRPEVTKKLSESLKRFYRNPENRKRVSESMKRVNSNPEYIEKKRQRALLQFKNGMPAETKKKISLRHKGKTHVEIFGVDGAKKRRESLSKRMTGENNPAKRLDVRKKLSGKNHHAWKGGITPRMRKLRNSPKMETWKNDVFKRDDWTCSDCDVRGGQLNAHHIVPIGECILLEVEELVYDSDNGETLCVECHHRETWGW